MADLDVSALAREIIGCLTGHTDPPSLFRPNGTTGDTDGSVTINLAPIDPNTADRDRTFIVTISQTS